MCWIFLGSISKPDFCWNFVDYFGGKNPHSHLSQKADHHQTVEFPTKASKISHLANSTFYFLGGWCSKCLDDLEKKKHWKVRKDIPAKAVLTEKIRDRTPCVSVLARGMSPLNIITKRMTKPSFQVFGSDVWNIPHPHFGGMPKLTSADSDRFQGISEAFFHLLLKTRTRARCKFSTYAQHHVYVHLLGIIVTIIVTFATVIIIIIVIIITIVTTIVPEYTSKMIQHSGATLAALHLEPCRSKILNGVLYASMLSTSTCFSTNGESTYWKKHSKFTKPANLFANFWGLLFSKNRQGLLSPETNMT